MSIYNTLNKANVYSYNPATYQIFKYKVGDRVRITVNYYPELLEDKEHVDIGTISKIQLGESLAYLIEEVDLWFAEDELTHIKG